MQIDVHQYIWQIILNPNALLQKSTKFWEEIENKLQKVQIRWRHHVTSNVDEAKEMIIRLCQGGERHFIVIGGDGSLNIFVNAVMESEIDSTEVYAALIPLGTGNDWSRSHGYAKSYLNAIDALMKGNFSKHDMGMVETFIESTVIDTRYFVNIAGFGFDGLVISNARKSTNTIFPRQLYLINLLKTLLAYTPDLASVKSDGFSATKNIFTIAVGIGQYNGNGMRQCPEAIPNDGLFDVVIVEKLSISKILLNIKRLFKGSHVKHLKEASMFRTDYLEIQSDPFIPGEVEGEILTAGTYKIWCLPSAINFLSVK